MSRFVSHTKLCTQTPSYSINILTIIYVNCIIIIAHDITQIIHPDMESSLYKNLAFKFVYEFHHSFIILILDNTSLDRYRLTDI